MTQIQLQPSAMGKKSPGKAQLKIDMTPMVDLGFLLISFFIFTTSMSTPAVTKLYMPADGHAGTLPKEAALTVLLSGNDNIYYYHGKWEEAVRGNGFRLTNYGQKMV